MISSSTIKHLRFPFSFFLMPVYLFALSVSETIDWTHTVISFVLIHILVYPASNGYNSYFDKDKESIGGLKTPPPVSKELYYTSLIMDLVALLLAVYIHWQFGLMILVYGLASKAYSHPMVRLKKRPIMGWLTIGFFQGYFTFIMAYMSINQIYFPELLEVKKVHYAGLLSSALLLGSYPMTQIYQHKEDSERGDQTLSIKLGLLGTFHFTAVFFTLAMGGFFTFYFNYYSPGIAIIFLLALTPVLIFFLTWYFSSRKDNSKVNFENTMRLNLLSSLCLNVIFVILLLLN